MSKIISDERRRVTITAESPLIHLLVEVEVRSKGDNSTSTTNAHSVGHVVVGMFADAEIMGKMSYVSFIDIASCIDVDPDVPEYEAPGDDRGYSSRPSKGECQMPEVPLLRPCGRGLVHCLRGTVYEWARPLKCMGYTSRLTWTSAPLSHTEPYVPDDASAPHHLLRLNGPTCATWARMYREPYIGAPGSDRLDFKIEDEVKVEHGPVNEATELERPKQSGSLVP